MDMEKMKRVILVTGMSGAGKSTATRVLEDMGYHVIDNYPVQLVSLLVDMIETSTDPRYSYFGTGFSGVSERNKGAEYFCFCHVSGRCGFCTSASL